MTTSIPNHWHHETDVAVVGGGGAGLAAALSAASQDARVLLIEKRPELGGTTGIAVGSFTAAQTSLQREAGIEDEAAWHNEDIAKFSVQNEPQNNKSLRAFFTEQASETFEWLRSLGVEFRGPSDEPPNRVPRMHNVVPNAKMYIAVCHRRALEQGVEILAGYRVVRLFREDSGKVVGLEARNSQDKGIHVRARRGIVLAAGDYSNNEEMKREFVSAEVAPVEGINPHATGDGHRLAREAGAALINMDLLYGPEIRFPPPPREPFAQLLPTDPKAAQQAIQEWDERGDEAIQQRVAEMLVTWQHPENSLYEKGAILVNRHGHRFVDETSRPELDIPNQPDKIAYIVFDQTVAEIFSAWPNFISTAPGTAYAYLEDYKQQRPDVYNEASTWERLAQQMRIDGATLETTVNDYNQAVEGLAQDPFRRSAFGSFLGAPPFYALGPVKSWIVTAEGGVSINERCAVLDARGQPVPGLFAAGANGMGGLVIWGHGLHIAWAFTSGRIAGKSAALNSKA